MRIKTQDATTVLNSINPFLLFSNAWAIWQAAINIKPTNAGPDQWGNVSLNKEMKSKKPIKGKLNKSNNRLIGNKIMVFFLNKATRAITIKK
jgi:hypothetical protein